MPFKNFYHSTDLSKNLDAWNSKEIPDLLVTLGNARYLWIHHYDLNPYQEFDKTQQKEPVFVHFVSFLII